MVKRSRGRGRGKWGEKEEAGMDSDK